MRNKIVAIAAALVLSAIQAGAQSEKASTRWNAVHTDNYQVIFPAGTDSLGNRYATLLEHYRPLIGRSAGFYPNERYRRPMPIVLHPFTGFSNGAVGWAPRRMEIYTYPDAYGMLSPMPWEDMLAIHENRHVAQMQFARSGFWRWLSYPLGQLPAQMIGVLGVNAAILEGDAVVAETALSKSGRGRSADFLSYYRMAFDNGDFRNWYRWRYGSQKNYTPDYYRIGYMTVAGARTLYDAPMFMSDYLHNAGSPLSFNTLTSTLIPYSKKNFKATWKEIAEEFASEWAKEDSLRAPFQAVRPLVSLPEYYTSYASMVETVDGRLFAVRSSLDKPGTMVEVMEDGSEKVIRPLSPDSRIVYSPLTDSFYWSEMVYDKRWSLQQDSRIKVMKAGSRKVSDLTGKGRYVNPAVSPDGASIVAAEYPIEGGSRLVLLDINDGRELGSIKTPDGLQITQAAFADGTVVFTAISTDGTGLYSTDFSSITTLESPQPFKVADLISQDGKAYFSSDKTGISEIFSYDGGVLTQLTNTKYGASRPFFHDGKLGFAALLPSGRIPSEAESDFSKGSSYAEHSTYPIPDKLSRQEAALPVTEYASAIPAPEKYSRSKNFLHFHSWFPFYYNYDGFEATESNYSFQTGSLGATAMFQNMTGTANGILGVSFHENPLKKGKVAAGIHGRLEYSGLYPVFDLSFDAGDRPAADIYKAFSVDSVFLYTLGRRDKESMYLGGMASVSVPFNFSSGGWERSLVPVVSITGSNDRINSKYLECIFDEQAEEYVPVQQNIEDIRMLSYFNFQAALQASVQLPATNSGIYPRWGVGGTAKYSANTGSNIYQIDAHAYLPGLSSVHGIKLSGSFRQKDFTSDGRGIRSEIWSVGSSDMAPRGFEDTGVSAILNAREGWTARVGAEYAMPVLPLDASLGPYFYLRNLELHPFFETTLINGLSDNLFSAGSDIIFRFEKMLFFPATYKMGARLAWNGGSAFEQYVSGDRFYFGAVVLTDLF